MYKIENCNITFTHGFYNSPTYQSHRNSLAKENQETNKRNSYWRVTRFLQNKYIGRIDNNRLCGTISKTILFIQSSACRVNTRSNKWVWCWGNCNLYNHLINRNLSLHSFGQQNFPLSNYLMLKDAQDSLRITSLLNH